MRLGARASIRWPAPHQLPASSVFQRSFSGTVAPGGAIALQAQKTLSGSVGSSGVVTKQVSVALAGSIAPAGELGVVRVVLAAFAGSVAPAGALVLQTAKTLLASVTPTGVLARLTSKTFAASVTPSGTLQAIRTALVSVAGSIGSSGALALRVTKSLGGTIAPAGTLATTVQKALAGAVAPVGTLTKRLQRTFSGSITPTGVLGLVTGAVTLLGDIVLLGLYVFDLVLEGIFVPEVTLEGSVVEEATLQGSIDVTKKRQDFEIYRGDKKRVTIKVTTTAGTPKTMTGATARWQLWQGGVLKLSKTAAIVNGDGTDDAIQFTIAAADLLDENTFPVGIYQHEAEIRDISDTPSTVAVGAMRLLEDLIPPP